MRKSTKSGPGPTGPRTPKGKATSSLNAIKHGVYSERVLPSEEDEAVHLHRSVRKELQLDEFEEAFFGTDLVLTLLKKKRLEKYTRYQSHQADAQASLDQLSSLELRWSAKQDSLSSPSRVHPDLSVLLLKKVRHQIKTRGLNAEADLPILYTVFSRGDRKVTFLGSSIIFLYELAKPPKVKGDRTSIDPEYAERQTKILEAIDLAIEFQQSMREIELLKDKEAAPTYALLPDTIADRISRSNREIQDHLLGQFELIDRYRRLRKRHTKS
jgi:hypothetical protein